MVINAQVVIPQHQTHVQTYAEMVSPLEQSMNLIAMMETQTQMMVAVAHAP